MKRLLLVFILAAGAVWSQPKPLNGIEWDANPADEQIFEYRIYRLAGNAAPKLDGIVTVPIYRPDKKGTFHITAVNIRGESPPSIEVKL